MLHHPPPAAGAGGEAGLRVPAPPGQPWEPRGLGHDSHRAPEPFCRCPLARAVVTAPSVRGPAPPQRAAPAPAVMASGSPAPSEAGARASPSPAHPRSAPMPWGGKHGTVPARQSSGTAEPPRTPSHMDSARAARAARAGESGQCERGQRLLPGGDRDARTTVAVCFSAQVH